MWRGISRTQKLLLGSTTVATTLYLYNNSNNNNKYHFKRPFVYAEAAKPLTWHAPTRDQELNKLKSNKEFDLLIVGGGATGAGVAVDAATRGLNVAVVERDDFASGTF